MSVPPAGTGRLPDGYEFLRVLGQGGSGWVALARQVQLDRLVAIKTIHTGWQDKAGVERLRREGRAIAALSHPNVVSVYALLISPTHICLVMEHLPAGDLRRVLDQHLLPGSHHVRLLCDVASGLAHAHSHGIVHRDIKPANILLSHDGSAKLADFGLARLPRSVGSFRTLAGTSAGTPTYMAPEQIKRPDLESPAIDSYAFSVLAYEVLTGARPYPAGDLTAIVSAHLFGDPIPPWRFTPDLPAEVGEALLAGLSKEPADRPSPTQLADRLGKFPPVLWDDLFRHSRPARPLPVSAVTATFDPANPPNQHLSRVPPSGQISSDDAPRPGAAMLPVHPPPMRRRARPRMLSLLIGALVGLVVGVLSVLAAVHR